MIASIVLAAASASAASSAASQRMVVPIYRCSTPGTRHPIYPMDPVLPRCGARPAASAPAGKDPRPPPDLKA